MERCTVLRGECHDAGCYVDTPHACHDILCTTKRLREQLADAQATIAALQARVKELEEITKVICGHCCEPMEIPSKAVLQSALTQRTAECDALKLVNDTHMKTVMKLSHVVEQRTAELEAAKADLNETWIDEKETVWTRPTAWAYAMVCKARDKWQTQANDLHAELERVRGELVEAAHNTNVYQSLYSTGCMDRALLENDLRDIRTLIAALPKVEGEIRLIHADDGDWHVVDLYDAIFTDKSWAVSYAALLQHRQGMEG